MPEVLAACACFVGDVNTLLLLSFEEDIFLAGGCDCCGSKCRCSERMDFEGEVECGCGAGRVLLPGEIPIPIPMEVLSWAKGSWEWEEGRRWVEGMGRGLR